MTDRSAISELLQDMLHISRQAADPVADAICRLQPARVPEGWQLVPRELTKEMFYARDRAPFVWSDKFATVQLQWREMLSAGPAAEGGMTDANAVMACHSDLPAALVARAKWGRGGQFSPGQDSEGTCKVMELAAENIRCLQLAVATAWDEGYRMGVNDERESEANIGIAGFGMKVEPARANPYRRRDAHPAPESREADHSVGVNKMVPEAGQREGVEAVKQSLTGGKANE